jgi:hypothetical protein
VRADTDELVSAAMVMWDDQYMPTMHCAGIQYHPEAAMIKNLEVAAKSLQTGGKKRNRMDPEKSMRHDGFANPPILLPFCLIELMDFHRPILMQRFFHILMGVSLKHSPV